MPHIFYLIKKASPKLDMVVHSCNCYHGGVEAGGNQSYPQVFSEFKANLGYTRSCLKEEKENNSLSLPQKPGNNDTYLSPTQSSHSKLLQSLA